MWVWGSNYSKLGENQKTRGHEMGKNDKRGDRRDVGDRRNGKGRK